MSEIPHDIQFALAEFDRNELSESQRELQGDDFLQAVQEYFASQFSGQGGAAEIAVTQDRVVIRWKESSAAQSLVEVGADHLKQGDYDKGIAILRRALERNPSNAAALFNLGMGLGDREENEEALEVLERLVTVQPNYPGAWVALGVAQARAGRLEKAIWAFREAVTRDSQDGFARKNLGASLSQAGRLDDAQVHLKAAVVLLQSDAQAWLNLAMNLEQSGEAAEAEIAYQRVMALAPGSQLSEKAELGRNRITTASFRESGGNLRPDVLNYCGEAIRMFGGMPKEEVHRITVEIAMLGAKGLSVNDASKKYKLRSLPGSFSGLHLLCIQYAGFKIIDPSVDIGFDIAAEYEEALRMHRKK